MRRNCKRTPRSADGGPDAADIAELADRIATATSAAAIVLFGSGARRELSECSDLDLAVLTHGERYESEVLAAARKAVPQNRAIDLLTARVEDVRATEGVSCSWTAFLIQDGLVVWSDGRTLPMGGAGGAQLTGRVRGIEEPTWGWMLDAAEWRVHAQRLWIAGRRWATRRHYPRSTHRVGAFAKHAAVSALMAGLIEDGRPEIAMTANGKLAELAAAWRGRSIRADTERIARLAAMRVWRFEGEEDVSNREALQALRTAWAVLRATSEHERLEGPPRRLGPPDRPWSMPARRPVLAGRWWRDEKNA